MKIATVLEFLRSFPLRSAWKRGVFVYAEEMLENFSEGEVPDETAKLHRALLNGAQSWEEYSYGGCALIYDADIAERLCTPSQLKRTRSGERRLNCNESWLDVQARALSNAERMIRQAMYKAQCA